MKLNLLLAEGTGFSFATAWPLLLLLVLFIGLMIFNVFSNKKRQAEYEKKLEELKVGDKVVTNAGIYGEIVSIRHTNFGKVALLKSGEDDRVSYISVNLSVILGIDEKHDVIVDSEGNIIDPEAEKEESKAEEVVVEPTVEVKEEKTEAKKTPAKKTSTTAKKTTTKKTTKKAE